MKKHQSFRLKTNTFILLFIIFNPAYSLSKTNKNIGELALNYEKYIGANKKDHQLFKELIKGINEKIDQFKVSPKDNEVSILKTIHNVILNKGYTYVKADQPFYKSLRTKKLDCLWYSLIYLSLAEQNSWPLSMVLCPHHVFVRWNFKDKSYINWEGTQGTTPGDQYYINSQNIAEVSIKNGVYLINLERNNGVIPLLKWRLAKYYYEKNSTHKAVMLLSEAEAINNNIPNILIAKGNCFVKKRKYKSALAEFDKAIRLSPNIAVPYYSKALIYKTSGYQKKYEELKNAALELAKKCKEDPINSYREDEKVTKLSKNAHELKKKRNIMLNE